jgi:8-oxo-dGTP pyrophosphatase MutT (NUDIX family)
MKYNSTWFASDSVSVAHQNLPVTQVYGWIFIANKKLVAVSKDEIKWQFPGGHPETGESLLETLVREIWEETGIDIKGLEKTAVFFGYYVVEELNDQNQVTKKYLQVRYLLKLHKHDSELDLKTNESEEDIETVHMQFVKTFTLPELFTHIKWLEASDEYQTIKGLLD